MPHALMFSIREIYPERGAGSHRIATFLRGHGWDVEVVDFVTLWTLEELKEFVRSRVTSKTVFFGFSPFFNYWSNDLRSLLKWMKEEYPTVSTVVGGQDVLSTPADNIDYWVDSYGELAILELVKYLTGGSNKVKFDLKHHPRKVIKALTAYPSYALNTYRVTYEKKDFIDPREMGNVELGRGCKFKCTFCNHPILGVKEDTSRSAEDFKEELEYNYYEFGLKNYHIMDETFNDRIEKVIKGAEVVDQLKFKPWFNAFIRPDLLHVHKPYWDYYEQMRIGGQYYGVESFHKEAGKVVGKAKDPAQIKEALLGMRKRLEPLNIYRGTVALICGIPKEPKESWLQTVEWIKEHWRDQAISAWFLEVPDYREDSSNSAMTMNLEKYGMRIMDSTGIDVHHTLYEGIREVVGLTGATVLWEHDLMNEVEASVLIKDFNKNVKPYYFKQSAFEIGKVFFEHNKTDIEDIITYDAQDDYKPAFDEFVKQYIYKKLSWRQDD
jgi:hypothetical protein